MKNKVLLLLLPLLVLTRSAWSIELIDCEKLKCTRENPSKNQKSKHTYLAKNTNVQKTRLKGKTSNKINETDDLSDDDKTSLNNSQVLNKNSMTLEEQQTYFAKKKWNFVLSTGVYRSLDELSNYYSSYSLSGNYLYEPGFFFTFAAGYDSIFYQENGGLIFNNESPDPRSYGLTNVRLGISMPGKLSFPNLESILSFGSTLSLPTSTNSQDQGLRASLTTYAQLRSRLTTRLTSSVTSSLILANHAYDDADVFGYQVNSPVGLSNNISLTYNFWKKLSAYGAYGLYNRYDYEGQIDNIQSVSSGLLLPASDKLYFKFSYMWQDKIITNDRAFNNRKSYYSLELSYSI